VVSDHEAHAHAPNHERPSTQKVEHDGKGDGDLKVVTAKETIEGLAEQVRHMTFSELVKVLVIGGPEHPEDMAPKEPIAGAMWVAGLVGILVVLPMMRNPINGAAFQGQCSQKGKRIFHGLGTFKRPVSEQSVVPNANAKPSAKGM